MRRTYCGELLASTVVLLSGFGLSSPEDLARFSMVGLREGTGGSTRLQLRSYTNGQQDQKFGGPLSLLCAGETNGVLQQSWCRNLLHGTGSQYSP